MNWTKVRDFVIGKGLPLLGDLIGGPANVVTDWIADAFAADPSDPDDVLTRMQGDPDAALKLYQLQTERLTEVNRFAQARQDALFGDRANIRAAVTAQTQATGKRPIHKVILAYVAVGLFGIQAIGMFFVGIPLGNKEVILLAMGVLLGILKNIFDYYFGGNETPTESLPVDSTRPRTLP